MPISVEGKRKAGHDALRTQCLKRMPGDTSVLLPCENLRARTGHRHSASPIWKLCAQSGAGQNTLELLPSQLSHKRRYTATTNCLSKGTANSLASFSLFIRGTGSPFWAHCA
jgi:hypothetical protein